MKSCNNIYKIRIKVFTIKLFRIFFSIINLIDFVCQQEKRRVI